MIQTVWSGSDSLDKKIDVSEEEYIELRKIKDRYDYALGLLINGKKYIQDDKYLRIIDEFLELNKDIQRKKVQGLNIEPCGGRFFQDDNLYLEQKKDSVRLYLSSQN